MTIQKPDGQIEIGPRKFRSRGGPWLNRDTGFTLTGLIHIANHKSTCADFEHASGYEYAVQDLQKGRK